MTPHAKSDDGIEPIETPVTEFGEDPDADNEDEVGDDHGELDFDEGNA